MNWKNLKKLLWSAGLCAAVLGSGIEAQAAKGGTAQASLVLKNSDMNFCNRQQSTWELTKTNDQATQPVVPGTTVTWTVNATKTTSTVNEICAVGYVSVYNGGSADATIGNIVVNLQRKKGTKWVSASVDVADATDGDGATSANIVANASQEFSPGTNYSITGATGTFTENTASGKLEFTDPYNNTAWAINNPKLTIPAQTTLKLFFNASFDNTILSIPPGESLRTEAIVTFGNSGGRGDGGASASGIDINGNHTIENDEYNVRSVPTRLTMTLPPLDKCNDTVQLTDTLSATSGASYSDVSDPSGLLTGLSISSSGGPYYLSAKVSGTGTVTNTVKLNGSDVIKTVQVPTDAIDPVTGLPVFEAKQIFCCTAEAKETSSSVKVTETTGFLPGQYCSASKGGYQTNNAGYPGTTIQSYFITKFQAPGYMEIGIYDGATKYGARWSANATGLTAVRALMAGGGESGAFTTDLDNPTATAGGQLAKQVAALTITLKFSNEGIYPAGLGSLYYSNLGDALHGKTISEIVDAANTALAGSGLPTGYTKFGSLNTLVENLNLAFDANLGFDSSTGKWTCTSSAWADGHLSVTQPQP